MSKNTFPFRILGIIIGFIVVLALVVTMMMNPSDKKTGRKPVSNMIPDEKMSKPVFRKDGELQFVRAKTLESIAKIDIEVADNDAAREQGLMCRDSMQNNQGMLFLMEREEMQSFWMKNTILPLDIIYADANRTIVSIHADCTPFSQSQIISSKPALYVVEVNAGFAKAKNLKPGDIIIF